MRSGAAAHHEGFYHEAALYGSDDDFVAIVVPFVADGVAAGEPVFVACQDHNAAMIRHALGEPAGVTFLDSGIDPRPGPTIRAYRRFLAQLVADGAQQVRVVGDVPHPGIGSDWQAWARYEAVINVAYDDFPMWGLCPYDTRVTPDWVLDDVLATHPHLVDHHGRHTHNDAFRNPSEFLASRPLPVETSAPAAAQLVDPNAAAARAAVLDACSHAGLDGGDVEDLLTAVGEVVANARTHGQAPAILRVHWEPADVTVVVTDRGLGPTDPRVRLIAPASGRHPATAQRLRTEIAVGMTPEGFAVLLRARPDAAG